MMPTIYTFTTEQEWASATADEILKDAKDFSIAISGGSTPAPVYRELSQREYDWKNSNIYIIDERFVPKNHKDSNQKLVRKNLKVPAQFHFWKTEKSDEWKESAKKYERLLKKKKKPIDLGILGIGPDGHTASLFPRSNAVKEDMLLATTSETDIFAVQKRLTMTFPEILSMKKLIILLKGKSKQETLDEFFKGNKTAEEFPAKKLLEHENLFVFYAEI